MNAKPNRYAILIGINRYHESLGPLKYAVNDCKRLADVLTRGQGGFAPENVLLVTDDQPDERRPTYANIHSWLASWLSQPKDDDTVLVYFCGHGLDMGGKCYLAPGDATLQTMHVTGISVSYVQDLLSRCNARQKLLILDACHSGAGRDVAAMSGSMMNQIATGKGIYTITACDADELSHEWDEKKQGVFSYYLAEGLSGSCPPDSQGRITAEALYEWVHDRVRSWAANRRCKQTPKRFAEGAGGLVLRLADVAGGAAYVPNPSVDKMTSCTTVNEVSVTPLPVARHRRRSTRPFLIASAGIIIAIVSTQMALDASRQREQAKRQLDNLSKQLERGEFLGALTIAPESFGRHRSFAAELKQKAVVLQEQTISQVLTNSFESRHSEVVRQVESIWKEDIPPQLRDAYEGARRAVDWAEAQQAVETGNSRVLFRLIGRHKDDHMFRELRKTLVARSRYASMADPSAFTSQIGRRINVTGILGEDLGSYADSVTAALDTQNCKVLPITLVFNANIDALQELEYAGMRKGTRVSVRGIVSEASNWEEMEYVLGERTGGFLFGKFKATVIPEKQAKMTINPVEAWEIIRE